ncbi:MAG TPA: patatin-like phospholipase family protein [Solirubrobacteraceae bacterium]|jgi:patatin-like phospholipase/acyl hydrolase
MPANAPIKVLSIDGGGIRGIIPAVVLAAIEQRMGQPACEIFDLIAGTSTGGIIALGVTVPGEDEQKPRWSAEQLAGMYESEGPKIFHRSLMRTIETVDGLLVEKYSAHGLERALKHYMGDALLSQALTDVLIPSYDIHAHAPLFFKSFTPRARPAAGAGASAAGDSPHAAAPPPAALLPDYPMTLVARATSAAPTYFEPEDVRSPVQQDGDYVLVDGGTFANNPAMCAYAEATRNNPGAEVLIVSLGTGRLTESISFEQAKHWGLIQWAHPLLGVIMDGSSAAIDYQLDELLGAGTGHFRFQTTLDGVSDSLDDVSPANIAGLRRLGEELVASEAARLEEVCRLLVAG